MCVSIMYTVSHIQSDDENKKITCSHKYVILFEYVLHRNFLWNETIWPSHIYLWQNINCKVHSEIASGNLPGSYDDIVLLWVLLWKNMIMAVFLSICIHTNHILECFSGTKLISHVISDLTVWRSLFKCSWCHFYMCISVHILVLAFEAFHT